MKILELFCGTKSISKVFKAHGWETFTIDNNRDHNPDLCADILSIDSKEIGYFDVVWASPPCTKFSVAAISRNWKNGYPKNTEAALAMAYVLKAIEIINQVKPKYWFIENPVGMMRTMPFMPNYKNTVTYCQYGENRRKPTDIWTNCFSWIPRKMCKNGSSCHDRQPRGYKAKVAFNCIGKGTQGLNDDIERGIIPKELCEEIFRAVTDSSKVKQENLLITREPK